MFGKGKREREKLERSGTRASATVVEIADAGFSMGSGGGAEGRSFETDEILRMTILRVEPEGEPAFDVRKRMRYGRFGRPVPKEGDRIEVLFDPSDHERIVLAPPTAEEEGERGSAALGQ